MQSRSQLIQPLESRTLLSGNMFLPGAMESLLIGQPAVFASATPVTSSSPTIVAPIGQTPQSTPAPITSTPAPGVRATSLVGHWEGKIKTKILFIKTKVSATLDISSQTATTLTGSIEIKGQTFSGTFTGKINPKTGRFTWKVKDGSATITLVGRLNTAGTVIVGDITAKYGGLKVKGSFRFDKTA